MKTEKVNTIVGIGEILWDMLPEGMELGGAPANFAYHTSQFGFNSHAVSAIGKDSLGELLRQKLVEKGLDEYPFRRVQSKSSWMKRVFLFIILKRM